MKLAFLARPAWCWGPCSADLHGNCFQCDGRSFSTSIFAHRGMVHHRNHTHNKVRRESAELAFVRTKCEARRELFNARLSFVFAGTSSTPAPGTSQLSFNRTSASKGRRDIWTEDSGTCHRFPKAGEAGARRCCGSEDSKSTGGLRLRRQNQRLTRKTPRSGGF